MYCSHCGQAITPAQPVCAHCGQQPGPALPSMQVMAFQLENYQGKLRALAVCWLAYAGLALVFGVLSLSFARMLLSTPLAPWIHPHHAPLFAIPALLHFAWITIVVRSALALVAGWGLWERTSGGRPVAILAAILNLIKFPFGTALGVWTLILLLGHRSTSLYEQNQRS